MCKKVQNFVIFLLKMFNGAIKTKVFGIVCALLHSLPIALYLCPTSRLRLRLACCYYIFKYVYARVIYSGNARHPWQRGNLSLQLR